jgi:Protein kinase domain
VERLERGDPRALGRYRILARLGAGGMAVVYLGRSRGGRAVAVKVVHAELALEPRYRERFRREVEATAAAGGVHSPAVLDADTGAATPWMATEFLPAVSLREAVERFGPLPAGSVRRLAAGLAEALAGIHRTGIAHLDVKPANVLLTADGPRLIDFGIAGGAGPAGPAGSWGFMSPEQVAGEAGPPSDVHSLGATLEYALGRRERDEALGALIADCLRPDASARPTAAELTGRLAPVAREAAESGVPWLPPRVAAAIAARASSADDPPSPSPSPSFPSGRRFPRGPSLPGRSLLSGRRRLLAASAAAAVALAAGTAVALAVATHGPSSGDRRDASRQPRATRAAAPASPVSSPAAPTPEAEPVTLEFAITGDAPLASLDYAVNGKFTTVGAAKLPWHKSVKVPGGDPSVDWRVRLTVRSGGVRIRVLVDGSRTRDERYPSAKAPFFGYPSDVDTGGSVTIPGALPGSAG